MVVTANDIPREHRRRVWPGPHAQDSPKPRRPRHHEGGTVEFQRVWSRDRRNSHYGGKARRVKDNRFVADSGTRSRTVGRGSRQTNATAGVEELGQETVMVLQI